MAHKSTNNESATSILPYWSKVLRALRKSRGVTQDCWAAQLGYSRATIRRWESGRSVEICNELAKLARPGTVLVSKAVAELADSGQYQFSEVPELAGSRFAIGTSVLTMKVTKGLTSGRQIAEQLKE